MRQRSIVKIVKFSTNRYTMCQPGDLDRQSGNALLDVMRRCLAIDCRGERQNDLGHFRVTRAFDKSINVKLIRAAAINRA